MTFINLDTIKTERKTGFTLVGGQCEYKYLSNEWTLVLADNFRIQKSSNVKSETLSNLIVPKDTDKLKVKKSKIDYIDMIR